MNDNEYSNSNTVLEDKIPETGKVNIEKVIRNTGNLSILISIFGFVLTVIANVRKYGFIESFLNASIFIPFLLPFFYFGNKLKKEGPVNLRKASKISSGMLIYTIFYIAFNALMGGFGLLWFVLLYFYYYSYKEAEKSLPQA